MELNRKSSFIQTASFFRSSLTEIHGSLVRFRCNRFEVVAFNETGLRGQFREERWQEATWKTVELN